MKPSQITLSHGLLPYLVAVLSVIAATFARIMLAPYLGSGGAFLLYTFPVVVVAFLGGLAPAVVTTAGAALLGTLLFIEPRGSLSIARPEDVGRLIVFLANGMAVSVLGYFLVRSREQLGRSERRFRAIVNQSQDTAIFFMNPAGVIESWNDGAEAITGFRADEVIGRHASMFHALNRQENAALDELIARAKENGSASTEGWRLRKDGSPFWASVNLSVLLGPAGEIIGCSSITLDRTREHELLIRYQESEQTSRALLESATQAVVGMGPDGRIRLINKTTCSMFDYAHEELIGQEIELLIPERYRANHVRQRTDFFKEGVPRPVGHGLELEGRRRDGTVFPVEASLSLSHTPSGPVAVAFISDITGRKEVEAALAREQAQLRSILDHAPVLISIRALDGRYLVVNRHLADVFGRTEGAMVGRTAHDLFPPDTARRVLADDEHLLRSGETLRTEEIIRDAGGTERSYVTIKYPVKYLRTEVPFGVCSISLDVSEQKAAEERALHAAQHDPLTGLPNRALVYEFGERLISSAHRNAHQLAVLFFDLDRFKPINDTYGHAAGDRMLQEVTRRIRHSLRESDIVGRLGGDEFVAILDRVHSENHVAHVAAHLLEVLGQPYQVETLELRTSPSIGISMYTHDGSDIDTLLRNADAAMYHAKSSGRNNFQFFTAEIDTSTKRVFELEQRLRQGLDQSDFELFYQPVIDTRTRRLVSAEALIRWRQANDTVLLPGDFIAAAEASGLIHQLGRWVIRRACERHQEWRRMGLPPTRIAVNVSPLQFRSREFTDDVAESLRITGTDPACFELEVTESTVMKQVEEAARTLAGLKKLGIGISLDDFGTGYSSLSHLSHLPIDKIKVDQSFVRNIDTDQRSLAITETVIALARKLNVEVVAEGIESEDALHLLSDRECDLGQGYFIGMPMPGDEFAQWYAAQGKKNGSSGVRVQ